VVLPCRDGCTKIFQKPLDKKKVEKNRANGIEITSALSTSRGSEVLLLHLSASPCQSLSVCPGALAGDVFYCSMLLLVLQRNV
jgi:hypothetical protein